MSLKEKVGIWDTRILKECLAKTGDIVYCQGPRDVRLHQKVEGIRKNSPGYSK